MGNTSPVREEFVQLWSSMGPFWGVSPGAARVFGWLISKSGSATAEELMNGLAMSRGAVSMACRELRDWGLVHATRESGARQVSYRAETNLEKAIRNIVQTRKRREWDPMLDRLREWIPQLENERSAEAQEFCARLKAIESVIGMVDSLADSFLKGGTVQRLGLAMLTAAAGRNKGRREIMKVLVTGASGFIGSHLTRHLESSGHTVLPVSRRKDAAYDWSDSGLKRGVDEADAVIHLAGENLFGRRWSAKQKELLRSSRIEATTRLARFVAARKPSCFISASAVGYYGASQEASFHEGSPPGRDFLAQLCVDWETSTAPAFNAGVRCAIVRTGVALGPGGGALAQMLLPFKLGLGGPIGSGRQWLSWIHIADLVAMYAFVLESPRAIGVFNGTAPHPVTMKDFASALGRALHRPAVLPVPGFALRLALGEVADVLLSGQRVLPRRAMEAGFKFDFPEIQEALNNVVG